MKKIKKIADLLPDGLSEEALTQVADLVESTIQEEVDKRFETLNSKVFAFLRMRVDEVKDHAMKELSEESELYRNAKLMEGLRSYMALELNRDDIDVALTSVQKEKTDLHEENEVLAEELKKSLAENTKLTRTSNILEGKVKSVQEDIAKLAKEKRGLTSDLKVLEESKFESSEKAKIITNESHPNSQSGESKVGDDNQFLTEQVMALMPQGGK